MYKYLYGARCAKQAPLPFHLQHGNAITPLGSLLMARQNVLGSYCFNARVPAFEDSPIAGGLATGFI